MIRITQYILPFIFGFLLFSCNKNQQSQQAAQEEPETPRVATPFEADSAYNFVAKLVAFGPRIPGSSGHTACLAWMKERLTQYGAKVVEQSFEATAYDGTKLPLTNLIASYNPAASQRILLMAHWDTRPWADKDPNAANHTQPILGADDGGSGVGVLLEVARLLGGVAQPQTIGVDIVLFDGEDYGAYSDEESWCLGSTHWSKNPHVTGYQAMGGILLDMVGGRDATFYWEYFSKSYAPQLLTKVWGKAAELGYGSYFHQADGGGLTDDHVPVIRNLGIPCIDIVNYDPRSEEGFAPYWHTLQDNMSNISAETLGAVGHTVMAVLKDLDAH